MGFDASAGTARPNALASAGAAPRFVELDGLRGLACLLVLIAHYAGETANGLDILAVGWFGVAIFFVLSGYLIGGIILDDLGRPGFFQRFYLRRTARIVPVYLMVLAATLAAGALVVDRPWASEALPLWSYLTFTTNVLIAAGADSGPWLMPTWTLAVEEQFYLLLPLALLATPRRLLLPMLGALAAGALLFRLTIYPSTPVAASTLLPARADLLLLGVAAALVQRSVDLRPWLIGLRATALACLGALLLAALLAGRQGVVVLSPMLLGIGIAAFILSMAAGGSEGRQLRSPVLCWIGSISYGLYLIHQPVNGLLHGVILDQQPDVGDPAQIAVTALAAGLSVALAWLSWTRLEKPIVDIVRRRQARAGQRAQTLVT